MTEKLAGSTVVKQERDYFDGAGQCIRHTDYSGTEEQNTYYTYKDSLLTQETTKGRYYVLNKDGAGGSVAAGEYDNTKTYEYDEVREVVARETDEGTAVADFTYAETGKWTEYQPSSYTEVTADDVTTASETYQYDENGNLTRIVDQVAGTFTNYSYFTGANDSAKGALKSEAEYLISDGTCLSSTDVAIEALSGNRKKETTTTISSGNKTVTEVIYDIMGRELESVTYTYTAFGTDKERISKEAKTYTYDGFGRVSGITTTTSRVNGSLAEIDGTSHTTTEFKTYDANGTLISETGADGITSSYQYDAMNRVTSTTRSGGGLSQTTRNSYSYGAVSVNEGKAEPASYDSAFITTETVDSMVSCVTYEDGLGRTVRRKRGTTVTDYSYDASGNAVTEYVQTGEKEGILTLHVVDKEGNETATLQNPVWNAASGCFDVGADTICETAGYDKSGNLVSQIDGNGGQTGFAYDAEGRITGVSLQNGSDTYQTSYAYSEAGEDGAYRSYVTQTAANGAVSVETTDADGNVVAASDQGKSGDASITNQTSYDAFGNVMEERHADGSRITYAYDAKDRVSEKTQIDKGGNAKYKTVYTYYDDDQVKETYDYKVSGSSQTLYHYVHNTYDGLKRLTAQAEVNGSSVPSDLVPYTTTYTYDLKDRLTAVFYGSACGSEVDGLTYTYSGSQLTDIHVKTGSGSCLAKHYTYDDAGRVSTVKDYYNFRAGDSTSCILLTYTYDAFGRVADMTYKKGDSVIEQHSYEYDKNSNIVKEHNVNTASDLDEVREYTYDDLSQLKHSVIKNRITTTTEVEGEADAEGNPTTTIKTEVSEQVAKETAYTYDSVGNRTKKVEDGTATSYTYNGLNQLLSESGGGASLTYSYDKNGNQTGITGTAGGSSVSKTFTYTPDNMLAAYTDGTVTQENLYTGDGQRIQKKEGNDVTNYFYQEGSVLYTTDGNGSLKSFNLLNISGAFGTARKSGTGENYYLYTEDLRGSTVNVLDNSASKVVSYWYNDFGEVTESKASRYSSFDNELQYTGAVHDASTGLLYLNARFYDPQTGRFISRDTYRGERNNADTWHLYLYCANNPVNYVDPSGHFKKNANYSVAHTFKYSDIACLGGVAITIVIKWTVKKRKIVSSSSYIGRKTSFGLARIRSAKRVLKKTMNRGQRTHIEYFVSAKLSNIPDFFLNKYSLPVYSSFHPGAIVYNDGGADWYKEGIRKGI